MRPIRSRVNLHESENSEDTGTITNAGSTTPTTVDTTVDTASSRNGREPVRLVAIRYFLDRPGYGLHNSAARLWFHPPAVCKPKQLSHFLTEHGIALDGLLVEVFLDKIQSFMMLDACEACMIEWDFLDTTTENPGVLNIRLTDLNEARQEEQLTEVQARFPFAPPCVDVQTGAGAANGHEASPIANVTPAGLFSFSMMVGLETAALTGSLIPGSVSPGFVLKWGPYMFFVGGLMQILVGAFQVLRNNVYGATAFLGFGSFWFSNGLAAILETFLASDGTPAEDLRLLEDDWGFFIRILFIFAFCCALEVQTFAMNRLSSTLIGLLCIKVFVQAFTGWSELFRWFQFAFGWMTSIFAFYVFLVEFTNSIYHREVFRVFRWSEKDSPEEVFGAKGRSGTLHSKAARLRQASYPTAGRMREAPVTPATPSQRVKNE